jgi:hypothetical protein
MILRLKYGYTRFEIDYVDDLFVDCIVIGFVNNFVIEKGIEKVDPKGAGGRGRAAGGVGLRNDFFILKKIILVH